MDYTHRLILTVHKNGSDRELRQFPFDATLPGSRDAALERMELYRRSLPRNWQTTWEEKAVREMATV